jgi:hypothetical protein
VTPGLFSSIVTPQENGVSALHIHHVELRMSVTEVLYSMYNYFMYLYVCNCWRLLI